MTRRFIIANAVLLMLLCASCEKDKYTRIDEMPNIDVPFITLAEPSDDIVKVNLNSTIDVKLLIEDTANTDTRIPVPIGSKPLEVYMKQNDGYTRDIHLLTVNPEPYNVYWGYGSIMLFSNIRQYGKLGTKYIENNFDSRMEVNKDSLNCLYLKSEITKIKGLRESAWRIPEFVTPYINSEIYNTKFKSCLNFDLVVATGDTLEVSCIRRDLMNKFRNSIKTGKTIEVYLHYGSYRSIMYGNDTRRFKDIRVSDIEIL